MEAKQSKIIHFIIFLSLFKALLLAQAPICKASICEELRSEVDIDLEQAEVLYTKENGYVVLKEGPYYALSFNGGEDVQGTKDPSDVTELPLLFARLMSMGVLYPKHIKRVLMVGLGTGMLSSYLHHYFPEAHITCVDHNPLVIEAAKAYFGVPDTSRHKLVLADGLTFLKDTQEKYDLIFSDAYMEFIPTHMATASFYALAKEKLAPNGALVQNAIPSKHLNIQQVREKLSQSFAHVDTYNEDVAGNALLGEDEEGDNTILIAYNGPKISNKSFKKRAIRLQKQHGFRYGLRELLKCWM